MWAATEFEPVIFARLFGGGNDPMSQRTYEEVVDRLETALAAGPYLMGERFSAVDVMIGATLAWARSALPESPALGAFLARIAERPAHAIAEANDAPAK